MAKDVEAIIKRRSEPLDKAVEMRPWSDEDVDVLISAVASQQVEIAAQGDLLDIKQAQVDRLTEANEKARRALDSALERAAEHGNQISLLEHRIGVLTGSYSTRRERKAEDNSDIEERPRAVAGRRQERND